MKIFVVTANVELTHKPVWLDDFRHRFDKPYHYHITLKQPCFVPDDQVEKIKRSLTALFLDNTINRKINLRFDQLKVDVDDPDEICIMLNSTNESIHKLQNEVVNALSSFNNYYKPKYQVYERNFVPHITIARNLSKESYAEASKELRQDYSCEAVIDKVILTVVNNFGPEEANKTENQTIYNFKD